jgi:hypothetical protein
MMGHGRPIVFSAVIGLCNPFRVFFSPRNPHLVLDMYWICIGYVLDLFVFEGPIQGNDSDLEGLDLGTESWGDS